MPEGETDFQKAVDWFHAMSHEERLQVCKKANPETPHSIIDKNLTEIWRDKELLTQFRATKEKGV